jgi:PAS domain S-box-containing protein
MRERTGDRRKGNFLETINTFGSILMHATTVQESAWSVVKNTIGKLGYTDCIIYLINDDGELYQCAAHGDKNPNAQDIQNPIKLKIGEGICGYVALTGIGEVIADTSKDPRYLIDDKDRYSEITVPILSDGNVIGIIDSEHPKKGYFSEHDLNILNTIASMLSLKFSQAKASDELDTANKELAFQNNEKEKRAGELAIANKELAFQNEEKDKRADELAIANKELAFHNEEKEKRADELAIANRELAFQNQEKDKRADELAIANKELAFQNEEKDKRADELAVAIKELAFQNEEKDKRADELAIANKELAFQNQEKEKRADELAIANKELAFQNEEKDNRADELAIANKELAFQNEEKAKRAAELAIANKELAFQNQEKIKRSDELVHANNELTFQTELTKNRIETESVAKELRQFIETANAPIFGIDSKGLVNEWNETSAKITGFQKEEVLGKDLVETYITEDYRESVKQVLENALKGKETANYEFPLFTKDDKRVMVLLNSSTRRNADGEIVGVLGVGQDISEMDKLRTTSESVAKELRQFIETANAPIFGIDSKGLVNEWNETSAKITGFQKEEVLGKDLVETYITEDYRESVKQVLENALKGQETANYEFPLFTKDGKRVMILLNSSTRKNAEGEIIGVLGVGQDITILNEYKENLESKVKSRTKELEESLDREKELGLLKTSFVSMASHEFRTPLTSIKVTSDVILKYFDKLSRGDINKRLEKIKREVEGMTIMLEDILIIGKSESQKLNYNPDHLNIVSLIKTIIIDYQLSESEKKHIVYNISSPVIMVNVDEKWIKHIIINLLSNAIKYSDEDKPIEIFIEQKVSNISFCFKDYGIGISKEDIKVLFEPFHRGKNVQNISGTGLGLSVLKKAVELHKGKIEVESEIGKGSSFIVTLPIV